MNQLSEQGITVYPLSTVEQIVSSNLYFFSSTLNGLFNLDLNISNVESVSLFKSKLLTFICPVQRSIYNIFDSEIRLQSS